MPVRSRAQHRYIQVMRNKYKSQKKAPKDMKWVFDSDFDLQDGQWEKLPDKIGEHLERYVSIREGLTSTAISVTPENNGDKDKKMKKWLNPLNIILTK